MRKQIVKKEYSNDSLRDSSTKLKFSVITANHVNLTLTHSHSIAFQPTSDTCQEWIHSECIDDLLEDARFNCGFHEHADMWKTSNDNLDIFGIYHRERLDFSQKITIPASSSVTAMAYACPVVGNIPFEAVYELTPIKTSDNFITPQVLNTTLSKQ